MMMYYKSLLFACLFFPAFNAYCQNPAAALPEFSFERRDGSLFAKKDLTPGFSSFFVFFDTECDHCLHAIEYLNKHHTELQKTRLYLVTLDSRQKVKTFLAKHGSSLQSSKRITLLFDTQNQFISKFGPRKYPSLMLYSKNGKLLLYDDDEKKLPLFFKKEKE